jgi:carboxyl-terminal processing protease
VRKYHVLTQIIFISTIFFACKKDKNNSPTPPAQGTREQLTLDSLYLYAQQMYLWYDALPDFATFNPRQYAVGGDVLTNYRKELYLITQLKINASTNLPYEYSGVPGTPKYSFMELGSPTAGDQGSVSLNDKGDDFGFALTAATNTDVRIRYVNAASPAANAGLARGYRVTAINGTTIDAGSSAFIDNAMAAPAITLSVVDNNGVAGTVKLTEAAYTTNPVFKSAVLTVGSQKVGYLAFSRFSTPASATPALQSVFDAFTNAGVSAVVVDLRYNGGGYTETAEALVNYITPSSLGGKVMYTEYFNDLLQKGQAPILKQQLYFDANGNTVNYNGHTATYADLDYTVKGNTYTFSKEGSLQTVKQVVFIVSGSTASASELTINSLKPYLPVKLVGAQTYGKPVGFFGIKIDAYTVYMSSFAMQNANGQGDYYQGMTPDIPTADDVTYDFGDAREGCLSAALAYISGHPNGARKAVQPPVLHMGPASFNGMIENRLHFATLIK